MRYEFLRFLLVGLTNTLLSYLLYLVLVTYLTYLPAYSIAYCVGILVSYFLNVQFVFKKRIKFASFLKFPVVYGIQYLLGVFILWLLVGKFSIPPELAMIGVIILSTPVTFLLSRLALRY